MALRSWAKVLLTAAAAAAGAGAAELGIGYSLGVVRFARDFAPGTSSQWRGQVAWVTWFAIAAAVVGALAASRAARRRHLPAGPGMQTAMALAAGVGAGAVAPLTMMPALDARLPGTFSPVLVMGMATGVGAAVGTLLAAATLLQRALRWNAVTLIVVVWLVGLLAVAPSLGPNDPPPAIRLGVLDLPPLSGPAGTRLAVLGMPVLAALAGAAVAGWARRRGERPIAATASGVAGPATVALAYLIAGPGLGADRVMQDAPYWGALLGVAAGALASGIAAFARRERAASDNLPEPADVATPVPADTPGPDSTRPGDNTGPDNMAGYGAGEDDAGSGEDSGTASRTPEPDREPAGTTPGAADTTPKRTKRRTRRGRDAATTGDSPTPEAPPAEAAAEPGPPAKSAASEPAAGRRSPTGPATRRRSGRRAAPKPREPRDDEYVDWVRGLGDAPGDGRHHAP